MRTNRVRVAMLALLWSGPQAPFLERYLRPGQTRMENPRRITRQDALMVAVLVVGVAVIAVIALALLFAGLMRSLP